jgi:hypothetical protein
VPKEYSVAAAVFAGVFFARWLFAVVLKMILPIPLLPVLMADLLGIYFLIVETRILGTLYASQKGTLGWFQTSCRANPASPERINDSP